MSRQDLSYAWWSVVKLVGSREDGRDVMSEVQKDLEDVSTGIGQIKKNPKYTNFVPNLVSKLARSTLTSPSRIRVELKQTYSMDGKGLFNH
jgi:hypothetical protein